MLRDIADGPDRGAADFARRLGDIVGHREDLSAMLIEQEVVIAKVLAAHVPVEVLGLNVKCKHVGEQFTKFARDLYDRVVTEVCRDRRNSLLFHSCISSCYAFSKA